MSSCHGFKRFATTVTCFPSFAPSTWLIDVNIPEFPWTVHIYFDGINSLLWSVCSTPHLQNIEITAYCIRPINITYQSIYQIIHPLDHPIIS